MISLDLSATLTWPSTRLACREGGHHVDRRFAPSCGRSRATSCRRWRLHPPTPRSAWRPRRRSDAGIPWRRASRKCRRGGRATAFHRGTAETGADNAIFFWPNRAISTKVSPRRALPASTTPAPLRAGRSPCRVACRENPPKTPQKNNRFAVRRRPCNRLHRASANRIRRDRRQIQHFSRFITRYFTRLPWRPLSLRIVR